LYFHPAYTCRPYGDVAQMSPKSVGKYKIWVIFTKTARNTRLCNIYTTQKSVFRLLSDLSEYRRGWGGTEVPSGRASDKPRPIRRKCSIVTYLTHARMIVPPDFPFSSRFIGKRDMPGTASEEEKMYLQCEYCAGHFLRGVADSINIY
jgi:hypothetical protein